MLFFGVTFKFLLDKLTSAQRNDSFILHHFFIIFLFILMKWYSSYYCCYTYVPGATLFMQGIGKVWRTSQA